MQMLWRRRLPVSPSVGTGPGGGRARRRAKGALRQPLGHCLKRPALPERTAAKGRADFALSLKDTSAQKKHAPLTAY